MLTLLTSHFPPDAWTPLRRASPVARAAAVLMLFAAVCVAMPHAFVSNAVLLAFAAVLLAGVLGQLDTRGAARGIWSFFFVLLATWLALVLLRMGLGTLWGEHVSLSGFGHALALVVPFVLGYALQRTLRPVAGPFLTLGLIAVAIFACLNAIFPKNTVRIFEGYRVYLGNDSIAIDVMLALLASGACLRGLARWQAGVTHRIPRDIAFALLASAPLLSFAHSRFALLLFAAATVCGAVVVGRNLLFRVGLIATVLAVIVVGYYFSPHARARLETAVNEVRGAVVDHHVWTSQGQRLAMASVSWHMIKTRPLTGYGVGNWRDVYVERVPQQWKYAIGRHTSPHNEYLHIATQLGIVGALLYAALWLVALRAGARELRRHHNPWLFVLALTLLLGSVTNVMLWDFRFWAPCSALLACALASAKATMPPRAAPPLPK